jgi:hypothetical protein
MDLTNLTLRPFAELEPLTVLWSKSGTKYLRLRKGPKGFESANAMSEDGKPVRFNADTRVVTLIERGAA